MNDTTLAQLERLARLRAEGVLSETEYEAAKRSVIDGAPHTIEPTSPSAVRSPGALSKTWAFRFDFMSEHGLLHSRAFTEAAKELQFWQRRSLMFSSLAFFFGPIYFLILGLWRPAVTLFGVSIIYTLVIDRFGFSDNLERAAALAFGAAYALTCIPLYYLKVTQGIHRWNPVFWWSAAWR